MERERGLWACDLCVLFGVLSQERTARSNSLHGYEDGMGAESTEYSTLLGSRLELADTDYS